MNPFKKLRTNRLSRKIILMVELVLILSNSIFCVVSIVNSRVSIRKSIQQRMLDIANCASGSIDGDILGSLTAGDEGTPKYRIIYDTLAIFRDNVELEYVYSIRDEGDGRFTFIVDTDPEAPGEFGSEVEYTEALAASAKGKASVDTVPYTDAWGQFYSAYSPVYDSSGRIAGIIAADFSVEWFDAQLSAQTQSSVFMYSIILLVTLAAAALLSLIAVTPFVRKQEQLSDEVKRKAEESEQLFLRIVRSLADAVDTKDPYTNGHSSRVSQYSVLLAEAAGWDEERIGTLRYAALLHDIGKIGVPDSILNSPKRLTEVEYEIIKSHTTMGGDILKNGIMDAMMENVARCHHEWYNGTGYPMGIKGEDTPEEARIVAIADAFDAMSSDRIYRKACEPGHIRRELEEGKGKQFDAELVDLFIGLWDQGRLDPYMENKSAEVKRDADRSSDNIRVAVQTFAFRSMEGADPKDPFSGTGRSAAVIRKGGSRWEALYADCVKFAGFYEAYSDPEKPGPRPFHLVLISMDPVPDEAPSDTELQREMYFMDRSIRHSVGDSNIVTRYGDRRYVIVLFGQDNAGAGLAVEEILIEYLKMNGSSVYMPSYLIAEMGESGTASDR